MFAKVLMFIGAVALVCSYWLDPSYWPRSDDLRAWDAKLDRSVLENVAKAESSSTADDRLFSLARGFLEQAEAAAARKDQKAWLDNMKAVKDCMGLLDKAKQNILKRHNILDITLNTYTIVRGSPSEEVETAISSRFLPLTKRFLGSYQQMQVDIQAMEGVSFPL